MSSGPTPFLKQLGHVDADALLERVSHKAMPRSAVIMHEGSAGENVALVLAGRVKLVARGVGERTVVLAIRGPGELVGEMAALGGTRRSATAIADEDVELGLLSGEDFRGYLRDHPDAARLAVTIQNEYFAPSCAMRGGSNSVTEPNRELVRFVSIVR